jgi:hypothetical protein
MQPSDANRIEITGNGPKRTTINVLVWDGQQ